MTPIQEENRKVRALIDNVVNVTGQIIDGVEDEISSTIKTGRMVGCKIDKAKKVDE